MATTIDVGDWLSGEGTNPDQIPGLFSEEQDKRAIALRKRDVRATVFADLGFCEVTEELSYLADFDCTARFIFPLPPRSAVYKFKATIGDRQVVTEVKKKRQAQQEFDTAVQQGHTAVQLKQQPGSQLYNVQVGNLAAMEEAVVSISYVRVLNSVAGAVEFEHQATWVPPYKASADLGACMGAVPTGLNPAPGPDGINPVFAGADDVGYTLSYDVAVRSSRAFRSVEPSDPAALVAEQGDSVRHVTLSDKVASPSKDFSLLIELAPLTAPAERSPPEAASGGLMLLQEVERQGKKKAVGMATFVPRVRPAPAPGPGEAKASKPGTPRKEVIFVIDGSGSMGGSPIEQALQAALFFVKDLPSGPSSDVCFNAVVFGSSHTMMWSRSKVSSEATQKEAVEWLQRNVHANYGGTEVLSVLRDIYKTAPSDGCRREIIFLTDGGVCSGEEQAIFSLVEGRNGNQGAPAVPKAANPFFTLGKRGNEGAAERTTIFSLGIGNGVHRGLVEGVAQKSGGLCQFVTDGEDIGKKAGLLKKAALAPEGSVLLNPRLVARSCLVQMAPNVLPPRLYADEPLHVLFNVARQDEGATLELVADTLPDLEEAGSTGAAAAPAFRASLPLASAERVPGDALAVLHAMASIGALLGGTSPMHCGPDGAPRSPAPDKEDVDDAVVALAIEEGLVTPLTSAVGVLLRADPLEPQDVRRVEVPLALPAGRALWGTASNQAMAAQHVATASAFRTHVAGVALFGAAPGAAPCAPMMARAAMPMPMAQQFQQQSHMVAKSKKASGVGAVAGAVGSGFSAIFGIFQQQPMQQQMQQQQQQQPVAFCSAPPPPPMQSGTRARRLQSQMDRGGFASPDFSLQKKERAAEKGAGAGAGEGVPCALSLAGPADDLMLLDEAEAAPEPLEACKTAASCEEEEDAPCADLGAAVELDGDGLAAMFDDGRASMDAEECHESSPGRVHDAHEVLALLNLRRSVHGSIPFSRDLLHAVSGLAWKQQQDAGKRSKLSDFAEGLRLASGVRPAALASADDTWLTVLAVAFLRKRLPSEQGVWSGLEAKALEWLAAAWPADAGRSVASCILGAMKLV